MPAPAQTTPDAQDPTASADPIALAAFVSRRGGRVLAYLDAVAQPDRALTAAGEAFAAFRLARAADPDAEAAATTLLRATRRAATAYAENPYRPEGRERTIHRTTACGAMPRLLIAWTEGRLPDGDVERLVEHLQDCPDCRALRDAFDRAELGYRGGETVALDGTEVGVIATAMALAVAPPEPASPAAPSASASTPRTRRTAIPAPPTAVPGRTAIPDSPAAARPDLASRPAGPAPVGRRTAIPERPATSVPVPPAAPAPPAADGPTGIPPRPTSADRPTAVPARPTSLPTPPARDDADVAAGARGSADATSPAQVERTGPDDGDTPSGPKGPLRAGRRPDAPEDPLGPEALGYAVPRKGLPRPPRRPAVPRVKRRRSRRPPTAAVAAAETTAPEAPAPDVAGTAEAAVPGPAPTKAEAAKARAAEAAAERETAAKAREEEREQAERAAEAARRDADAARAATEAARDEDAAENDGSAREEDRDGALALVGATASDAASTATSAGSDDPASDDQRSDSGVTAVRPAVAPATVTGGGLTSVGRRALQVPIVRQLGVPAVLLLAVLIGALIAAGAFAGRQQDTVAPVTRPTIPTVPANPAEIPPLR